MDSITPLISSEAAEVNPLTTFDECKITDATAIHVVQLMIPAMYLGHIQRVSYLAKRWESMSAYEKGRIPMRNILLAFYFGLASAGLYRRKKNRSTMANIVSSMTWLKKGKQTYTNTDTNSQHS
jgi:hypothetical protein